jgi:hypothetical protein
MSVCSCCISMATHVLAAHCSPVFQTPPCGPAPSLLHIEGHMTLCHHPANIKMTDHVRCSLHIVLCILLSCIVSRLRLWLHVSHSVPLEQSSAQFRVACLPGPLPHTCHQCHQEAPQTCQHAQGLATHSRGLQQWDCSVTKVAANTQCLHARKTCQLPVRLEARGLRSLAVACHVLTRCLLGSVGRGGL